MGDGDAKKWMSCLGWGCLALLVISVLAIGSCVAYVYKGGSAAHSVGTAYLDAVDAGSYEEAFELLGAEYTSDRGLTDFVTFEQETRAKMGFCGDWRVSGTSIDREPGISVAILTYRGSCEGGPVEVVLKLEQIDGEWVIQDIRYNEPGVPVVPVCNECGNVVPLGDNFCAACGAAIGGESAPEIPVAVEEPTS